jgi:hypothetical protein
MKQSPGYTRAATRTHSAPFAPVPAPAFSGQYSARPVLPTFSATPSDTTDNGLCRMLGGGRSQTYAVNIGALEELGYGQSVPVPVDQRPATRPHPHTDPYDDWSIDLGTPSETEKPQRKALLPHLTIPPVLVASLAVLVLIVLAWAFVTPAFAAGMSISRYHDLGSPPASRPAQASVIDTSAAVPAASQQPQPAVAAQPAAGGSYSIVGSPSISVAQIEAVLQQYGSPAAGLGQHLYDLGVQYGIDPAYALAFFVHESGCGTKGVARSTHSLGNIRWTEGWDNFEGYRQYPTWEAGMEDWYKLVTDLYINQWGLRTVDAIIPVYAPSGDGNNPAGYIASVEGMVDSWRGK